MRAELAQQTRGLAVSGAEREAAGFASDVTAAVAGSSMETPTIVKKRSRTDGGATPTGQVGVSAADRAMARQREHSSPRQTADDADSFRAAETAIFHEAGAGGSSSMPPPASRNDGSAKRAKQQ